MTQNSIAENKKRRPLVKESVSVSLLFSDIIAMSLSFILAFITAPTLKNFFSPDSYNKSLWEYANFHDLFFIWMCPIALFLFFVRGHYTQRVPWWSQVQNVLYICAIALIIDAFTRYTLHMSFSRWLITLCWAYLFFLSIAGRQIVYILARKRGIWRIPTIVIGDVGTVTDILYAFSTDHYTGYDVHTVYLHNVGERTLDVSALPMKYANIKIISNQTDYKKCITDHPDDFFVVALETLRSTERDNMINALTSNKALYAIVPSISRMNSYEMEPRFFFGYDIMLLHAKNSIFSTVGRFIKRSMDIILASIALLLLSPIMLMAAIMLKVEGQGGTTFYGGKRIGKHGQKFKCWKFRSMEPNTDHLVHELLEKDPEAKAEWEKYRKLKNDPRITTKTARFIRKASIDELPQLWNVIKGDMSLVGPRPILDDEIELFGDSINEYHQVRPGITGLWQVSGRNDTSFQRRVYWDSWYVRNWSVWGDIVIMIKTLRVVLGGSGAF